jgi:tRNA(fMet)-specific endonuclease VapC
MYFLDTNICLYFLNGTYESVTSRLEQIAPRNIKIPSMVMAEILLGIEKGARSPGKEQSQLFFEAFETVSFDRDAAYHYSLIRAYLEKKGIPIGPSDLIIAATAAARGGILVTHNTGEFKRVPNLRIEDWVK